MNLSKARKILKLSETEYSDKEVEKIIRITKDLVRIYLNNLNISN